MEWLSDYVSLEIDPKSYSDRMTDTGSKVEGFEVLGDDIQNVLVGKLLSVEKHPDSDHLQICMVDVGQSEAVQIVTGAQNVKTGDLVPAALHNSTLPGGIKIKSGKLRGVPSNGMLCSLGELNLTLNDFPYAEEEGIFLLSEDCKPGDDIRDVLHLRDTIIDFEITPNRPDCLSVIGLARETAASFDKPLTLIAPKVNGIHDGDKIGNYISVEIEEPSLCPRYTARVVKNVKIAPSPKWLRARLRASGIRPINNIVDITNYVCLEYGQPMHAFDYNYIDGKKILVRCAKNGELITTLDGTERKLNETMLVISDSKKAVAVAGVMGGENSEIKDDTKTIVFESANFNGPSVRVTARDLGLRTESSARYEKGLDRENTLPAIERACELIELLGAGDVVEELIDIYPNKTQQREIPFDEHVINRFLGTDIPKDFMLKAFGMLEIAYNGGKLIPPSFRADIECMQDIAEEVIRIFGYNLIPSTRFKGEAIVGKRNEKQLFHAALNRLLIAKGYYEIQTYSFISPKVYDEINLPTDSPLRNSIVISNPLGEDTSIMRTTALANVLEVLATNRRYRNASAAVYEMAKVYFRGASEDDLADEKMTTVFASYNLGDFYTMKGLCEEILSMAGIKGFHIEVCSNNPSYHPGRCGILYSEQNEKLITFGEIHPNVSDNFGFDLPVLACECDTDLIFAVKNLNRQYKPLPKYPAITRDLAFVCDNDILADTLKKAIISYSGKQLESVEAFDVYRDAKLGENKKSIAYKLVLRAADKTLSDEECDKVVTKVLTGLEKDFGVTLRM